MSKGDATGSKRIGSRTNKGMGKCSGTESHSTQCGKAKEVSKGKHVHFEPIKK